MTHVVKVLMTWLICPPRSRLIKAVNQPMVPDNKPHASLCLIALFPPSINLFL